MKFTGTLHDFQKDVVSWFSEKQRFLLCLDMGLGKTILSINYLCSLPPKTKHLIILPKILINQWVESLVKFTDVLERDICIYTGSRKSLNLSKYSIVITTYDTYRIDVLDKSSPFQKYIHLFNSIIVDEAHKLRNSNTLLSQAFTTGIKSITYRLFLTGTPIINRMSDLQNLARLLGVPAFDNSKEWIDAHMYVKTKAQIDNFDLPAIKVETINLEMDRHHQNIYGFYDDIESIDFDEDLMGNKEIEFLEMSSKINNVLTLMLRQRQCCAHPDVSIPLSDGGNDCKIYDKNIEKYAKLLEIVNGTVEDDKIVVFTQWNKSIRIICDILQRNGVSCVVGDNIEIINNFSSSEEKVLVLSLLKCSTGLNITCANHVIIMDPYWNDSIELQAINRVHRIGQKKEVSVYKIITENTIETKLLNMKSDKQDIIDSFMKLALS